MALLLARWRPHRHVATALGWGGVVALVACGAVLDGAHEFPGYQAAWPVLSAVAVIVAADAAGRAGAHRVLSSPVARWLGTRSYVVYLWHWPVLVLYLVHTGRESPSIKGAAAVVAVGALTAALLLADAATTVWMDREADRVAALVDDPAYPGAAALEGRFWKPAPSGQPNRCRR